MQKQAVKTLAARMALFAAATLPCAAGAQQTPWSVRLGVIELQPANKSDAIPALGVPSDAIQVNSKAFPELDILYTFLPNIVAELVLTYPQKQDVTLSGANIGTFKHLPPSLVGQYHFLPGKLFDPYAGIGVNFTWITSVHLNVPGVGPLDLSKTSVGLALDVGGDFNFAKRWFVNADIKYIRPLESDLSAGGTKVSTVRVNPELFSLGVGYRF
jgi:outer membrane protein